MATAIARSVKVPDEEWNAARQRAAELGETVSDAIRRGLRRYSAGESYRAEVYRDGKWWMIRVPELDAVTQARRESEVWTKARDLIAVTVGSSIGKHVMADTVNVELVILPGAKEEP